MSPDGSIIYQPSFEKDRWYVVNAENGSISTEVVTNSRAHNTVFSVDGREAYLAGLGSSYLTVADAKTHKILRKVGPFSGSIRPFTVNGDSSLVYVNVNGLLGFEIGDLKTGKKLHRATWTSCRIRAEIPVATGFCRLTGQGKLNGESYSGRFYLFWHCRRCP